jgi:hypothetical protein
MTQKTVTLKFIVPEALAVAFVIIIVIGIVYLAHKYPVPTFRADADHSAADSRGSAELQAPDGRLSRVHMLLSRMK